MNPAQQSLAEARRAPLVLASGSPRRQQIMRLAGLALEVRPTEAEPAHLTGLRPAARAAAMARAKALAGAAETAGRFVVAADTLVALGRKILEKPPDADAATTMLRLLSGRHHQVYTAYAIAAGPTPQLLDEGVEVSTVGFRSLTAAEIAAYVAGGDPLDKAGAYGIQSADLVVEVLGSYLNVVGLPLARLLEALARLGWPQRGNE